MICACLSRWCGSGPVQICRNYVCTVEESGAGVAESCSRCSSCRLPAELIFLNLEEQFFEGILKSFITLLFVLFLPLLQSSSLDT